MKKEMKLPKIKKTINAFLVGEEGKISKQSVIKAGVILTAVTLGSLQGAAAHSSNHDSDIPHQNSAGSLSYSKDSGIASTSHSHHASHSSDHSSHGNEPSGGGDGEDEEEEDGGGSTGGGHGGDGMMTHWSM